MVEGRGLRVKIMSLILAMLCIEAFMSWPRPADCETEARDGLKDTNLRVTIDCTGGR